MNMARYEKGSWKEWFGYIPCCKGLSARAKSRELCAKELEDVLKDWVAIRKKKGLELPEL